MTALLVAWLLAAGAQTGEGYRVAGVVVNAASGQSVAGARVTIAPVERRDQKMSMVTADDGRFAFTGLPKGKYELTGRRRGLLPGSCAGAVVVGPDQDTGSIALRMSPPAVISGKVVDDAGEPVAQAQVELLGSKIIDGRRGLTIVAVRQTDDTGEYRFSALWAGSYYLVVSGVPWYTKFTETLGESAPPSMTHSGYATRYYPNVIDPAAAEPLILKAGQEATANFTLLPVPAVLVQVHCEQFESLTKHYTLTAAGLAGNLASVRQGSETGELYNLWGVLPGHYTIRAEATDGSRTWYGASEFDAAAGDTDVSVTLDNAPSLSGMVVPDGGGSLPAQFAVQLRDEAGRSRPLAMGAGGRFSTPAIPPGRYRFSLSGADEYYLKSQGEMLDIRAGAAVRLTLAVAKGAGRVAGTVYRDGHPLPGALVVLTPANRTTLSDSDGSYEFQGVSIGQYSLFAVEDGTDLEYANPEAIRQYLSGAKRMRVGPGSDDVRLTAN